MFRLPISLAHLTESADFFAPTNWRFLDEADEDVGGTNPLPIDISEAEVRLVLALGKDGKAYLLNRKNLGGIGGALVIKQLSNAPICTSPASFPARGAAFVALQGRGTTCPNQVAHPNLIMLRIHDDPAPAITTAWCGSVEGQGAPIVTTTDGHLNP